MGPRELAKDLRHGVSFLLKGATDERSAQVRDRILLAVKGRPAADVVALGDAFMPDLWTHLFPQCEKSSTPMVTAARPGSCCRPVPPKSSPDSPTGLGWNTASGPSERDSRGVYTGRLEDPSAQGGQGRRDAGVLAGARHLPEDSYAYSDSASDLPMLEAVGHPVAVNPEPELREIATDRGWPIIETARIPRVKLDFGGRPPSTGPQRRRDHNEVGPGRRHVAGTDHQGFTPVPLPSKRVVRVNDSMNTPGTANEASAGVRATGVAVGEISSTVERMQRAVNERIRWTSRFLSSRLPQAAPIGRATEGVVDIVELGQSVNHRVVRATTGLASTAAAAGLKAAAPQTSLPDGPKGAATVAGLSAAFGDHLDSGDETLPLTTPMGLRLAGRTVGCTAAELREAYPDPDSTIVVFVHGLAVTELNWSDDYTPRRYAPRAARHFTSATTPADRSRPTVRTLRRYWPTCIACGPFR